MLTNKDLLNASCDQPLSDPVATCKAMYLCESVRSHSSGYFAMQTAVMGM